MNLAETEHTGLSVIDIQTGKNVFNYKEDNYFTPASNTKILTLYASLLTLSDHLDAAWYTTRGDSLVIWGGGDPGTMYPLIHVAAPLVDLIRNSNKAIVFSSNHFQTHRFGQGWAWDDYPFNYQCERNAFPIYGNRLWIERKGDLISVTPSYLSPLVKIKRDTITQTGKSEWGDGYTYSYNANVHEEHKEIPITFFRNDIQYAWTEATGKQIVMKDLVMPPDVIQLKGSSRDSLLKIMMQKSDNFISEQLLLACSLKKLKYMSEEIFIDSMMKGQMAGLPHDLEWIDGSGLSRYNQMTPHSMVSVLQQVYALMGRDYIKAIFPAGGQSGSLANDFKGKNGLPYIYAKTGTMRHVYCLSGFLFTRSGKILVFSWMNNQFTGDATALKMSMEKFFTFLYDHY